MQSKAPVISHFLLHLNESLSWIIPVSLSAVTLLLIIFGLAGEIGSLKLYQKASSDEIKNIKGRVADLEEVTGLKPSTDSETPVQPGTSELQVTYSNEASLVKNIKSKHKMRQSESCNRSVPVIKFKYDRESICF